jgi:hypothetical protein
MKKFLFIFLLLISTNAFGKAYWYNATCLTGGTDGCLDTVNGQNLVDGDRAIVVTSTNSYFYLLDDDLSGTESSPDIINPDSNAGTKSWVMQQMAREGVVYPEWYGEIDGTADDVQIQAAIDANPGGTVELQGGKVYTITSGILMDDDDTHLYAATRARINTSADIDMIAIGPANRVKVSNIFLNNTHGTPTNAMFKLNGKAKHSTLREIRSNGGKYAIEMDATAGSDPGGIFYNEIHEGWLYGTTEEILYMTGAVNENKFYGGMWSAGTSLKMVTLDGNNNLLFGVSFENSLGDDYELFTIYENGLNQIISCRFETDAHGVLVNNSAATNYQASRIYSNYWATLPVFVAIMGGRVMTDTYGSTQTFSGFQIAGNTGSTTVDVESASGQKVLSVADTSGFQRGGPVIIDEGNADEEWNIVDTISSGVSLTLLGNLDNTHEVAVTVTSEGKPYGTIGRLSGSANATQIWAQGEPVVDVDGTTKMVEVSGGLAFTPVYFAFTTESDIPGDTTGSEATILILNGDDDSENDSIDLQDGVQDGHVLYLIAGSGIDGDDTVTINMADTTCTGCPAIVMNARNESAQLIWTTDRWTVVSWDY